MDLSSAKEPHSKVEHQDVLDPFTTTSSSDFSRSAAQTWATTNDIRDMSALGLHPTFMRRFRFVAMVAFSSMVTVAWQNLLAVFQFALYNGGPGGLFWGFVFSIVGMGLVYLSLAELSSA